MEPLVVIIHLVMALFVSSVFVLCALNVRRHPEKMAGYNTMPREKRARIDLSRIGRFISNMIFASIPFMLVSPFMPNQDMAIAMLVAPPIIMVVVAVLYVNIFEKRFYK